MTNKDWTGNTRSAHAIIGARNYATEEREENDYYATEPLATEMLLQLEQFSPFIWECACGGGHISEVLKQHAYFVYSSDLINRGYGKVQDFLSGSPPPITDFDIITNPPYSKAADFVNRALDLVGNGHKVAMFLKVQFLEGKARWNNLYKDRPPKTVYVSSARLHCALGGDFDKYAKSNAIAYAWYVWEKGFSGDPTIKWFNH